MLLESVAQQVQIPANTCNTVVTLTISINSPWVWKFWKFMNPDLELGVKNEVKPYFLTCLWCVTSESNEMVQYSIHIYPYPCGTLVVRSELEVSEKYEIGESNFAGTSTTYTWQRCGPGTMKNINITWPANKLHTWILLTIWQIFGCSSLSKVWFLCKLQTCNNMI